MGLRSLVRQATNYSTSLILDAQVIFNSRDPQRPALPRASLMVRSGGGIIPSFGPLTTRGGQSASRMSTSCALPAAEDGHCANGSLPPPIDATIPG